MTDSDPFRTPPRDASTDWTQPTPAYGAESYPTQPLPTEPLGGPPPSYPPAAPPGPAAPGAGAFPDYARPYDGPQALGQPAPAPAGTDGVSVAALVTGVLGLGVIAIVLGALGLRRTAEGRRTGGVMAWIGLALGTLGTIVWTAVITAAVVVTPAVVDAIEEAGISGPQQYGEDARLDALWDQCAAGDMVACDDLFEDSPIGSDYERFGDTCGERREAGRMDWCEG